MKRIAVLILALVSLVIYSNRVAIAQRTSKVTQSGMVCVSSVPVPSPGEKSLANPAGGGRSFNYTIRINDSDIQQVSHREGVKFTNMALGRRHIVRIYRDGNLAHTFRFTFEKEETQSLCLWFNALYETWSLWPYKEAKSKCACAQRIVNLTNPPNLLS